MHGHMEAVAVVAEVLEGTLAAVADILAVDTLADTAVTLVAAGGTRVVIIILEVLVITVAAIMVMARVLSVAGVADGVTARAFMVAIGDGDGRFIIPTIGGGRIILPTIGEDPIPILIHIMQPRQRPCRSPLRTATKDKSNPTIGIIVRIHKATTRMLKTVRAVG